MSGLVFITAPESDHKITNRLLLHLKDWRHGSSDRFTLVTSRSVHALGDQPRQPPPTSTPVGPDLLVNEWAGASTADVEAFCLALDASGTRAFNAHLFVVLDADGVEGETCVFAQRVIDWRPDPIRFPERFDRARMPWGHVYLLWANLDISHLVWSEMMLEGGEGEDYGGGWWTYNTRIGRNHLSDEKRRLRDEAISRLEGEGNA